MMDQQYSNKKTLSDKLFTIAHFLGVLALVGFVVGWWEPRVLESKNATMAERGELEYWKGGGWGQKDFGVELVSSLPSSCRRRERQRERAS